MLSAVEQGGPAVQAGLMSHDLVVALDGVAVTGVDDLVRLLDGNRIGKCVTMDVPRLGRVRSFEVMPTERSAPTSR
jgi:predicted metalloprotease with PDZ domain